MNVKKITLSQLNYVHICVKCWALYICDTAKYSTQEVQFYMQFWRFEILNNIYYVTYASKATPKQTKWIRNQSIKYFLKLIN